MNMTMPTDAELWGMYGEIMRDPAITALSKWREPNTDVSFDDTAFLAHVEAHTDAFMDDVEKALAELDNGK